MKLIISIIVCTLSTSLVFSQSKQDYNWLMGLDPSTSEDDLAYRFDFNQDPFLIESNNGIRFGNQNASVSNLAGELLFYTTGCSILNRNGEQMPNGDSINYNVWMDIFSAPNCEFGYTGFQDILILNDPSVEAGYYVIQKTKTYDELNQQDSVILAYSYVNMELNNGLGDVVEKNKQFYERGNLMSSYLTAISHSNKKDWWILQPTVEDSLILCFLLNEDGITKHGEFNSHQFFSSFRSSASGTAKFSPDGTKYALFNYYDNMHVYDFDRNNGILSNHRRIDIFDSDSTEIRFAAVEWSPSSKFIYASSWYDLHQVELIENNFEVELIDEYNGTVDPVSTTFQLMSQGPDCRIYMCSFGGVNSYHVINDPDNKGVECNFVQNQLKLPFGSGFASLPNFPRYRVDEDEKCDSDLINQLSAVDIKENPIIKIVPNPSNGFIRIEFGTKDIIGGQIISIQSGAVIENFDLEGYRNSELDYSHLTSGVYILKLEDRNNKLYFSKMVVR